MDPAERLADYLAGELDADEHAAVEAALARDPALRAERERLQRADAALAALASPAPPQGFEARLHAALTPELAHQLGTSTPLASGTAATATGATPGERIAADEAAAARARREARASGTRGWRWVPALGGVAASLLLLVVAVSVVSPFGADDAAEVASGDVEVFDDAGEQHAEDAVDDVGPMSDRDVLDEEAAEGAPEETAGGALAEEDDGAEVAAAEDAGAGVTGPEVVPSGRALARGEVDDLLAVPAARTLAGERLGEREGTVLAERWAAELGATIDLDTGVASDDPSGPAATPDPGAALLALLPAERTAVSGCLTPVLTTERPADAPAIPAYVELVTFEDEPAVAYVLVVPDATDRFTGSQVWVVARDDCRVLAAAER